MSKTGIDALNNHLFETIEMVKNNNDPKAEAHEKIDIESAKTIADIGKVIVEGFKVQVQVLSLISKTDNPSILTSKAIGSGILLEEKNKA